MGSEEKEKDMDSNVCFVIIQRLGFRVGGFRIQGFRVLGGLGFRGFRGFRVGGFRV